MITPIDGPGGRDDWEHIDWEKGIVWYEESNTIRPLTSKLFEFTRGKHAGLLLSEFENTNYLKFIRSNNQDDPQLLQIIELRLNELDIT